jgi:hypothetical protein
LRASYYKYIAYRLAVKKKHEIFFVLQTNAACIQLTCQLTKGAKNGNNTSESKLGKQEILAQLDYRVGEAQDKGDTELEARILAVKNLALLLPECY